MSRRRRDAAGSSLVGGLAALLLVGGSVATVLSVTRAASDVAEREAAREVSFGAVHAADLATRTAGQPSDWQLAPASVERLGLLAGEGSALASHAKLARLGDGSVDASTLARALGLGDADVSVHLGAAAIPIGGRSAPGADAIAVVHATLVDPLAGNVVDDESLESARLVEDLDPDFQASVHDWQFRWTTDPSVGHGNTFLDHAWHVQLDLVPRLAGLAATYVNLNNLGVPSALAEKTAFDQFMGPPFGTGREITAWHVVSDGTPAPLPASGAARDHVLTISKRKTTAGADPEGLGLWRVNPGYRSWAVLGPVPVAGAAEGALEFDHYLSRWTGGDFEDRARILFWDATAVPPAWTDLAATPACAPLGIGWKGDGTDESPPSAWETASVDLCDALPRSADGLWLAFYWDTYCANRGVETACAGNAERAAGWFIDDVRVTTTVEGAEVVLFETDFEPPAARAPAVLVLASGVDHARADDAPVPALTAEPVAAFVEGGGAVLALEPGTAGSWLSRIGLEAEAAADLLQLASTLAPDATIANLPHDLTNTTSRSAAVAWSVEPSGPFGAPDEPLVAVQAVWAVPQLTATLLTGRPFALGGPVTALAYDLAGGVMLQEADRDMLLSNAYVSIVQWDPGVESGDEPPGDASTPGAAARRLVLAPLMPGGAYAVPIAIEVRLWSVEQG